MNTKRYLKLLTVLIIMAVMSCGFGVIHHPIVLNASSATSRTVTSDSRGELVQTQDAYLPQTTYTDLQLKNPSELFITDDDIMLISDTGNRRILIFDTKIGKIIHEIVKFEIPKQEKLETFGSPNGVVVAPNGNIYVADQINEAVYVFDQHYQFVRKYTRPDSVLMAERPFKPMKIAVDHGGNMYIIGAEINEGILLLTSEGQFQGYFASNKVHLSVLERLQQAFYTEAQKKQLKPKNPPTFLNIATNKDGLLFSTTTSQYDPVYIKRHNTAGVNQFKHILFAEQNTVDIWVGQDDLIYALSKEGRIFVYTETGEFIYFFGQKSKELDIAGLFRSPASITVDSKATLWVLDNEKNTILSFKPTDYAKKIYSALDAYRSSRYLDAIEIWKEVLELNQMSRIAHNNIGLNYLYSQQYHEAMYHLKIANNRNDYSKAFWEVRNIWIQHNLTWMVSVAVATMLLWMIMKRTNKKWAYLAPVEKTFVKVKENKMIRDYLAMFYIARHPEDGFYDLKTRKRGSTLGAVFILATFFITYLIYLTSQGFIYQGTNVNDISFFNVTVGFFGLIFVFIICNYLVTSITDGNGGIKEIFQLVMYSAVPMIISLLSITVLSHVLAAEEAFFLQALSYAGIVYTVFLILKGMQEIQGYRLKKLVASIVLTALLMLITVLVLLILFVLSQELIEFLQTILKEGWRNVTD